LRRGSNQDPVEICILVRLRKALHEVFVDEEVGGRRKRPEIVAWTVKNHPNEFNRHQLASRAALVAGRRPSITVDTP
jgi:hypothetical protein